MKKKWVISVVVIALLGGFPVYQWMTGEKAEAAPEEKITEVKVKTGDLRITELADGNLEIPGSEILSPYSGRVLSVTAFPGSFVEAGDKILEIAMSETQARDFVLGLEESLLKSEKEKIDACETLEELEAAYAEGTGLLSLMTEYPGMYPALEIQELRTHVNRLADALDYAGRACEAASEAYEAAREEQVVLLEALEGKGSLDVLAPYDGTLLSVKNDAGDFVMENNPLFTLGNPEDAYVRSSVSELDMGLIAAGQKAVLNFEINYGNEIAGEVAGIDPEGKIDNNGIVTYEVRIRVTDPLPSVLNGLSAQVEFVIRERTGVMVIPNSTVKIVDGKQMVEVKTETGSEMVAITTGFTDGMATEVLSGLEVGQTLLIRTLR
ncbi:MAG: hypothetical protein AVO33_07465 [delta proteobacterium ML8_F1]|nr:MAG: hypothetical protein AVO33_07465 [delta proteobacterium ML8_F1]